MLATTHRRLLLRPRRRTISARGSGRVDGWPACRTTLSGPRSSVRHHRLHQVPPFGGQAQLDLASIAGSRGIGCVHSQCLSHRTQVQGALHRREHQHAQLGRMRNHCGSMGVHDCDSTADRRPVAPCWSCSVLPESPPVAAQTRRSSSGPSASRRGGRPRVARYRVGRPTPRWVRNRFRGTSEPCDRQSRARRRLPRGCVGGAFEAFVVDDAAPSTPLRIAIPAGETVYTGGSGDADLILVGMDESLLVSETDSVTLTFQQAGGATVDAVVSAPLRLTLDRYLREIEEGDA